MFELIYSRWLIFLQNDKFLLFTCYLAREKSNVYDKTNSIYILKVGF